jgi:hypothetical protein
VTDITPVASTMTVDRVEQVMSLIASIQGQDSQSAQSSLSALVSGGRQATPVAQAHPIAHVQSAWARSHGYIQPESYKAAGETGGISYNTYLYLDEESGLVYTTTNDPWNLLNRKIKKKFLRFRCSIRTSTCMVSYRTTQLGVLLYGTKVKEDTYACLRTRCNNFSAFSLPSSPSTRR